MASNRWYNYLWYLHSALLDEHMLRDYYQDIGHRVVKISESFAGWAFLQIIK